MAEMCPVSGRKIAPCVAVFNELGEVLSYANDPKQVAEWLESGAYIGTGSTKRITHLIKVAPDNRLMAADSIVRPPKTCRAENLDGYRVYSHTSTANTWNDALDRVSVDDAFAAVRRIKKGNKRKRRDAGI